LDKEKEKYGRKKRGDSSIQSERKTHLSKIKFINNSRINPMFFMID